MKINCRHYGTPPRLPRDGRWACVTVYHIITTRRHTYITLLFVAGRDKLARQTELVGKCTESLLDPDATRGGTPVPAGPPVQLINHFSKLFLLGRVFIFFTPHRASSILDTSSNKECYLNEIQRETPCVKRKPRPSCKNQTYNNMK